MNGTRKAEERDPQVEIELENPAGTMSNVPKRVNVVMGRIERQGCVDGQRNKQHHRLSYALDTQPPRRFPGCYEALSDTESTNLLYLTEIQPVLYLQHTAHAGGNDLNVRLSSCCIQLSLPLGPIYPVLHAV